MSIPDAHLLQLVQLLLISILASNVSDLLFYERKTCSKLKYLLLQSLLFILARDILIELVTVSDSLY